MSVMQRVSHAAIISVLLAGGLSTVGYTRSASAETLADALANAYVSNPGLAAEQANLRAIDEQVPQALSNWRPKVFINGQYGVREIDRETGAGVETNRTDVPRSVGLTVSQNLFRGFRSVSEAERARARVAAGRSTLIDTEQTVLLEAATAYMDVVRDKAILDLRDNNVNVIEQQLQATRDRFDVGELTRTDIAQAESRRARSLADRIAAEAALESAQAAYRKVVGHEPSDLTQPDAPAVLPQNEQEAVTLAQENNPDVLAAEFSERAARANVDLVRGEFLPTLSVNASVDREKDVISSDTRQTEKAVTLSLSVPLYQAGAVSSRVREAKQIASRRMSELALSRRVAEQEASESWESWRAARAQITSLEAGVRAQEVAFEGVQQEAQVGSRSVLDVLDAEQELLDSRVSLVGAQRNFIVNSYRLLAAVGRLTAQGLQLAVTAYDPVRNYQAVEDKIFGTGIRDE